MQVLLLFTIVAIASVRSDGDVFPGDRAQYQFEYGVASPQTGDVKAQRELRAGQNVLGEYALREADGTTRLVRYRSAPQTGLEAIVQRTGVAVHPPQALVGQFGAQGLGAQGITGQAFAAQGFGGQLIGGQGFGGQQIGGQGFVGQQIGGQTFGGQQIGGQAFGEQQQLGGQGLGVLGFVGGAGAQGLGGAGGGSFVGATGWTNQGIGKIH